MDSSIVIDGLGVAQYRRVEYTGAQLSAAYIANLETLKRILDKRPDATPPGTVTAADYDSLMTALGNLQAIARNGVTEGIPPSTYYLTYEMAQSLNMIVRSLSVVGIGIDGGGLDPSIKIQLLQNWQNLAGFGIADLLIHSVATTATSRSLQSMIELEYVKEGNELIANQLASLQEALETTQSIIEALTIIQGISNQITVTNRGKFAFPPTSNADLPINALKVFEEYAADHLGASDPPDRPVNYPSTQPWPPSDFESDFTKMRNAYNDDRAQAISIAGASSGPEYEAAFNSLHGYTDAIKDFMGDDSLTRFSSFYKIAASAQFSQIFPTATPANSAATQLITAKNRLIAQLLELESQSSTTRNTPNSLANFIFKVATDISTAFVGATTSAQKLEAVKQWILDNQQYRLSEPGANLAGNIQDAITQAIKGAESLNDSQKQEVSRYLLLFEQFYKSSSEVLQKINQIVQKIATGISR